MKTPEQLTLEKLALSDELSRQLCHDFSNFVYNLGLQIEIWEGDPEQAAPNWDRIKQDCKSMAGLLKQWNMFRGRIRLELAEFDLHELIRSIATDHAGSAAQLQLGSGVSSEARRITGNALGHQHLLRLLLDEELRSMPGCENVTIDTEKLADKICLRMVFQPPSGGSVDTPKTLIAAACQSLAIRLDASIRREVTDDDERSVVVEFQLG